MKKQKYDKEFKGIKKDRRRRKDKFSPIIVPVYE